MRKKIINIVFALALTIMTVLLAVSATVVCAVRMLEPKYLTPLVENFANKVLDADVSVGKIELSFVPAFPVLQLDVDSLSVRSKAFRNMPERERAALPEWADSLLFIEHFSGALDLGALLHNEIALHRVKVVRPGMNIVLSPQGKGNFDIYASSSPVPEVSKSPEKISIPAISIDHFDFIEPKAIRYYDMADSTTATVMLLGGIHLASETPAYRLSVSGNLDSPIVKQLINLQNLSFGLDGKVLWHPEKPTLVALEQFSVRGAFAEMKADVEVDFDSTLTVSKGVATLSPVKINDLLSVLPDSLRNRYRLFSPYLVTDATIAARATLTRPFTPMTDKLPHAHVVVAIPDCGLKYGKAKFRHIGLDLAADLRGENLDSATVSLIRFEIAGPATQLALSGEASKLMSDPAFNVLMQGDIEIRNLPSFVANLAQGYLSGYIDSDVSVAGRLSMLSAEKIHKLDVKGRISGKNLYYLSNDTSKMVVADGLKIAFGSRYKIRRDSAGNSSSPFLAASVDVDTATALLGGVDLALSGLHLSGGVENNGNTDTTLVVPLGGKLSVKRFNVLSITDSAGMRARRLEGKVSIQRYKGMKKVPVISADLGIGAVAAGSSDTRFVIRNAHLNASMHKKLRFGGAMKKAFDEIRKQHPDLPADSVFKLAIEKRRGHKPTRRVYTAIDSTDYEMLEWNLAKGFRKFLLGWQLSGELSTRRARLFTPYFPLRNRINNLDIVFSNDTVSVRSLRYSAGRSDLAVAGKVTNIARSLTSKHSRVPLKINFDINSDTIDVNQLADAMFAGAAYGKKDEKPRHSMSMDIEDEKLDKELDAMLHQEPEEMAPILIPVNIDGQIHLKADNIIYSDLAMREFGGDILVFDGGVNLHRLRASSDAGGVELSALYSAPKASDIHFGFGLDLERINIERFLGLVPAVDSIMPLMRDLSGIIDAEIAATVDIDSTMNMVLPTLDAAVRLTGDSLAFINPQTYATLGKWLRFRDRTDNKIKHASVEIIVRDNMLRVFPFSFDIDRYRLAVAGYNDLALNFNYHLAVLKSPLPFKFGITVSGNPDKYKVRFGGAKYKEQQVAESVNIVDTARVNLMRQIENVFRRGVQNAKFSSISRDISSAPMQELPDTVLSASDSLSLIKEGLLEAPANLSGND